MKFLAISGSARAQSTNTALLRAVADIAGPKHEVSVFADLAALPVFSPDLEASPLPLSVSLFVEAIRASDAVLVSSPEYVRAIPGGLKNAIDWLVSRDEIIAKPIALLHASHRGDDMLGQLRLVLSTVSAQFYPDLFLRFELMKATPAQVNDHMQGPEARQAVLTFLNAIEERAIAS
ncbi:NADPH-dependent FMN reductase [Arenibacterium sp. LLYu02]|uniref:NADPH-dependent FMN reductase n=1 Tax=Arenibacterium sp. LLYu02 TaxID=3404132 RepID=UPI003B20D4B1